MTYIKSVVFASVLFSGLAQAALHPYYKRNRQLETVLKDARVYSAITDPQFHGTASGTIDAIVVRSTTSAGYQYEISSGSCKLDVTVKVVPQTTPDGHPIVGPGKLELYVPKSLRC